MSSKFIRTGVASTPVHNDLTSPTAVRISGNGLRGFHRSSLTTIGAGAPWYADYKGQINAEDWSGSSWSRVSNIGGSTGGNEIYNEGKNEFQISKNGGAVAWDFTYHSPDTSQYTGIAISPGPASARLYAFIPANPATPSYAGSTLITPFSNSPSGVNQIYTPKRIRFSDDASRRFIYYASGNNLIEGNDGSSLFFPVDGTYGNNLRDFELSGNGDHIFVFIGGSLKLFSWNGLAWQFSNEFITSGYTAPTGATASVNYDGTVVAVRGSTATRVYKKTGNAWAQLGADLPSGTPWVNSTGTLVSAGSKLYEWTGSTWDYKWDTLGAISDDGTVAVTAAGPGSIIRYELKDVAPIYFGGTLASAIYAGASEGKAIYYGSKLLWNVAGWEPPAFSPKSIPGLRLWLDASVGLYDAATGGNIVTTAAPVLRWEDQSGNGFHATAVSATAPSLALSQVNSLPALVFNGSQQFSVPNVISSATAASAFVVVVPSSLGGDGGPMLGNFGSASSSGHYPYQGGAIYDKWASTSRKGPITQPPGFMSWHLYHVHNATGDWRYYFNGAQYFTTPTNTFSGGTFGASTYIAVDQAGGTYRFRGAIAEIVIYDSALSESDRQAVTEYLRAKYNLWTL